MPADPARVAKALAPWFEKAARPMTWRGTRDPYAIWVSEIMLQQTRVDTVERFYSRFLQRFPTVGALAAADEDDVVEAWSGLGYYRRARFLHRGARFVVDECGGELPRSAKDLRRVPGVGAYTAGAIASIAFDRPEPLVDGNVARVSSRLRRVEDPREQDAGHADHWDWVRKVLSHGRPRTLSQALMELGATVCTPRNPDCANCPLRRNCAAATAGDQDRIPAPKKRSAAPKLEAWAPAILYGGRILLERRPDQGLLAGMWCLPVLERRKRSIVRAVAEDLGAQVRAEGEAVATVVHVFTHRVWTLTPWIVRARRRPPVARREDGLRLQWFERGERPRGGLPRVTQKLLTSLDW